MQTEFHATIHEMRNKQLQQQEAQNQISAALQQQENDAKGLLDLINKQQGAVDMLTASITKMTNDNAILQATVQAQANATSKMQAQMDILFKKLMKDTPEDDAEGTKKETAPAHKTRRSNARDEHGQPRRTRTRSRGQDDGESSESSKEEYRKGRTRATASGTANTEV
jgi:hypothetical protein